MGGREGQLPLFAGFTKANPVSKRVRPGSRGPRTLRRRSFVMTEAPVTTSLVHQYAAMKPTEFGKNIEPKWQVAGKLVKQVQDSVEQKFLTPLDGARLISEITAS